MRKIIVYLHFFNNTMIERIDFSLAVVDIEFVLQMRRRYET